MGPPARHRGARPIRTRTTSRASRGSSSATASDACTSPACAVPAPAGRPGTRCLRDGPPRGLLATGARIRLGEVRLSVLWPDPGAVPLEPPDTGTGINNVSVVFLGEANGRRFLLMGDVEQGIDPTLLARGLPRVDVLKVAHHGSATATTQAFVDAVRPRVAIASAGAGNPYGHPARSTLDRLRAERRARLPDGPGRLGRGRPPGRRPRRHRDGTEAGRERRRAPRIERPTAGSGRRRATIAAVPVRDPDPGRVARVGRAGHARAAPTPAPAPRAPRRGADRPPPGRHPLDTILRMTVPDRREAASVLRSLSPSAKFVRHACAVGRHRGVPGDARRPAGPPGRPAPGGDRGAPARRRQAGLGRGAGPPPARRGLGGLARGARPAPSWRRRSGTTR